jgi:hypothetical protein
MEFAPNGDLFVSTSQNMVNLATLIKMANRMSASSLRKARLQPWRRWWCAARAAGLRCGEEGCRVGGGQGGADGRRRLRAAPGRELNTAEMVQPFGLVFHEGIHVGNTNSIVRYKYTRRQGFGPAEKLRSNGAAIHAQHHL